ncbi:MAG: ABC transporter permease subunit, partial [Rhodospirillaceae bacterium]
AFAIGFAFLLTPSGWLVRIISPWLTGWDLPPNFVFVHGPGGFALMLALVCKEVFFLMLMLWAALEQIRVERLMTVARSLGYSRVAAWIKVVFPMVYKQIRLPVYAVLAYGVSVVDMSLVLGPTLPPTFSVLVLQWAQDPDFATRAQAAAGATLLLFCVVAVITGWRMGEALVAWCARRWLSRGGRRFADPFVQTLSGVLFGLVLAVSVGSFLALVAWSFAGAWRFPDALPATFSLDAWFRHGTALGGHLITTMILAFSSAGIALFVVIGCLENERWHGANLSRRSLFLLYLPLIVPQISFLFGLQIALVVMNLDGTWAAVIWSHLVFVLPYAFLVLSDPYRALDERYARTASTLGASPARVFWRVRLPLLIGPIAITFAVAFAVSVTQYLATLLPGAGQLPTLATEAIILSSGGDRRVVGVYGVAQMVLPLLVFAAAAWISAKCTWHKQVVTG